VTVRVQDSEFFGAELARVEVGQRRHELAEFLLLVLRRLVGHVGGDAVQQRPAVPPKHVAFHRAVEVVRRRHVGRRGRLRRGRRRCRCRRHARVFLLQPVRHVRVGGF